VPPRRTFNPASARAVLPYVSMIEIKEPRIAQVRLVGTAIVNRTRIDNTGSNMMDLLPPETQEWSWNHFRRLLETPCGCTFLAQEDYERTSVLIEIVSFPLADQDNRPQFIVSLSIETDRQNLMLRGDQAMHIADLHGYRYIDIGAGV
jgi:PAS domain